MYSERKNADYIDCRIYLSESADVLEQIVVVDQNSKTSLARSLPI